MQARQKLALANLLAELFSSQKALVVPAPAARRAVPVPETRNRSRRRLNAQYRALHRRCAATVTEHLLAMRRDGRGG